MRLLAISECKELEPELGLVGRTQLRNPVGVKVFLQMAEDLGGALSKGAMEGTFSAAASTILESWLEHRREAAEKKELWVDLFGFTRNSEVFVGKTRPSRRSRLDKGALAKDAQAAMALLIRALASLPPIIGKNNMSVPPVEYPKQWPTPIDWHMNLVSVGGPAFNAFCAAYLGDENVRKAVPYTFANVKLPSDMTVSAIVPTNVGGRLMQAYIPELYQAGDGNYVYNRDYGMIIKGDSIVEGVSGLGRQVLIIAGCHSAGTQAAQQLLEDVSALRNIWEKIGNHAFQAIVGVDVHRRDGNIVLGQPRLLELVGVPYHLALTSTSGKPGDQESMGPSA